MSNEPLGDYASHNAYIQQLERDLTALRQRHEAELITLRQRMVAAEGELERVKPHWEQQLSDAQTALAALRQRHAGTVERLEAWARSNDEERQAGDTPTFLNPHTVLLWMGEAKKGLA